jgi:hypothetical protein
MKTETAHTPGQSIPSIDHSLISPSGRMSKRAREAALKREAGRLFPPGYWDKPKPTREDEIRALEYRLSDFQDMAERAPNYKPRRLKREIEALKVKIEALKHGNP